ncbi:SOUL family heme-binding protein [Thiocapsa roseopersicina]|uniref:SOUL heme-binding protein n=1 Tax=Thiocapsa roseopersicina TaxID=1058 RepID=A0A1H3A2M2_THIRO|nr:heme-binding protein [Thiocapsa roseopersicina]SDX23875.1 SOUL heme-binding protein [Thiocapsa roseopersicina]
MKTFLLIVGVVAVLGIVAMAVFVFVVHNVETPEYVAVESDGAFELRDYPALVVAETTRAGARREALGAGFGPLARYIFAKERGGEKIAMTAPVIQQRPEAPAERIAMTAPVIQSPTGEDAWSVRFIMPSGYSLEALPAPATSEVRLREIPAQRRAAVRFSGSTTDAALAEQEAALRTWMTARGLTPAGPAVYAYYNDPFTPGFLRRNEVLIDVAAP